MAGPLDIQRLPKGLVDLFGMKGTGDSPHLLSEFVFTSAEITDLYTADRLISTGGTTAAAVNAAGNAAFVGTSVPPGEMWLVQNITAFSPALAAGGSVRCCLGVSRQGGATIDTYGELVTFVATETPILNVHFPRPLVMLPADVAIMRISLVVGVPGQFFTGYVRYVPLKI
jgi:hypothetical protein